MAHFDFQMVPSPYAELLNLENSPKHLYRLAWPLGMYCDDWARVAVRTNNQFDDQNKAVKSKCVFKNNL